MRILTVALVVAASLATIAAGQMKETCRYESATVDGSNKICLYSCPSGSAAITIPSHRECPLTIVRTAQ